MYIYRTSIRVKRNFYFGSLRHEDFKLEDSPLGICIWNFYFGSVIPPLGTCIWNFHFGSVRGFHHYVHIIELPLRVSERNHH